MQKKASQCAVACYDGVTDFRSAARCVERCSEPFQNLHKVANGEFETLQTDVQGCQKGCMSKLQPQIDAIKSGLAATPSELEQKGWQLDLEQCAEKCMNDAVSKLPEIEGRLDGYLARLATGGA